MERVYFIPSMLSFIQASWREDGTYSEETFPADAVLIEDDVAVEYWKVTPPAGKMMGVSNSGLPVWVDIPVYQPTPEELRAYALSKRDEILRLSAIRIDPLQDAVDLDDATPEETALLEKWKQYRVAVNRIQDQPGFPSSIEWPIEPT